MGATNYLLTGMVPQVVLHEFLVSSDPSAGSPLLTEVGNKFASVGLCEQVGAKNGPAYRGKSAMLVIFYQS